MNQILLLAQLAAEGVVTAANAAETVVVNRNKVDPYKVLNLNQTLSRKNSHKSISSLDRISLLLRQN